MLYDSRINAFAGGVMTEFMLFQVNNRNPWALILPNRNLFSNSPADINSINQPNQEPPVQKKTRGSKQRSSSKTKKSKATFKSVAGIPDDETVVDPASVPFFQSFTSSFSDASDE